MIRLFVFETGYAQTAAAQQKNQFVDTVKDSAPFQMNTRRIALLIAEGNTVNVAHSGKFQLDGKKLYVSFEYDGNKRRLQVG